MSNNEFFPQRPASHPMIYAYYDCNPQYKGLLKVGYTEKDVKNRVSQQYPTRRPDGLLPYKIVLAESAMRNDGSSMKQINAQDVLDIAMAGTSATLLARRWESALLVNVDNETLARLMANKDAMDALMRIEGFRSLNSEIETIINRSEAVKKAKKEGTEDRTPEEKKELTEAEKEYKSMRKEIQKKLIKFATRIPIFMYLTDYRERSLQDVITQLEPGLFKKVTGLDVKDFQLLVSLNVFNGSLMNDAIFKFKRFEDSSLSYTGIDKHEGEDVGGWDIVVKRKEYEMLFNNQQSTLNAQINDMPFMVHETTNTEPYKAKSYQIPMKPDFVTASFGIKSPIVPEPVKKEKKPEVDVSGITVGMMVEHNVFGQAKLQNSMVVILSLCSNRGANASCFQMHLKTDF